MLSLVEISSGHDGVLRAQQSMPSACRHTEISRMPPLTAHDVDDIRGVQNRGSDGADQELAVG